MFRIARALLGLAGLLAAVILAWRWIMLRSRAQQRWYRHWQRDVVAAGRSLSAEELDGRGALSGWLYRAGFRGSAAAPQFLLATGFAVTSGLSVALVFTFSGLQAMME